MCITALSISINYFQYITPLDWPKNDPSSHNLTEEDATKLAQDMPLWRLLQQVELCTKMVKPNNDDDDDNNDANEYYFSTCTTCIGNYLCAASNFLYFSDFSRRS